MDVEYKRYIRENKTRFIIEALRHGDSRRSSRRKRDEDEEKMLTQLDVLRWRRAMEKGKVVYLGGGVYRISIENLEQRS
ncbi:MAG: hypothetical protein ACP5PQ_05155 [Thermoproteota archaeon]